MERWTRGCVALGLALSATTAAASPVVPLTWRTIGAIGQAGVQTGPSAGVSRLPARQAGGDALTLCRQKVAEARMAFDRGDLAAADGALRMAEQIGQSIPDAAFGETETRPWQLRLELDRALDRASASRFQKVGFDDPFPVDSPFPATAPNQGPAPSGPDAGRRHFEAGMRAIATGDREGALLSFEKAWDLRESLDPGTRQALQDQMTQLRGMAARAATAPPVAVDPEAQRRQAILQTAYRQMTDEIAAAKRMQLTNPRGSLTKLQSLRQSVQSNADLDDLTRQKLVGGVDREIVKVEDYIRANLAQIELEERNNAVKEDIARSEEEMLALQQKIADLVAQHNALVQQQRYAEAEVVAKQAYSLAPKMPEVVALMAQSTLIRRVREGERIASRKEQGVFSAFESVEEASIPFDDRNPIVYGDARKWNDLSTRRLRQLEEQSQKRSPAELQIEQALKTPVDVRFVNVPLIDVMTRLGDMVGINIHVDQRGLANEGVMIDQPVTLNLPQPISLKSALNTILRPHGLESQIQNEMLLITSRQMATKNLISIPYPVADLVIPIPNFVPSTNFGLSGAMKEAYNMTQFNRGIQQFAPSGELIADAGVNKNRSALAQMNGYGLLKGSSQGLSRQVEAGPDSLGGASMADYSMLMELITTTIDPDSWEEVGGPSLSPFPTNLTLVVRQTQENHEAIADLLRQLRRLQDLQVTIEVRFITLRDDFFERIGVDFQFNIDDNFTAGRVPGGPDSGRSATIGLGPDGNPTGDLDLQFRQGSFATAVPTVGGPGPFDPASAANFGFAILSDIEVYLLLQAAQGDQRSNVLQAPKVTLFNGQMAFINDTLQVPFVTSVTPIVGDFAVGQQPIVVVLNEGTQLSVQAVVSQDRRFVRLTLVPFFSRIGNVTTFTFQQKQTYDNGTSILGPAGDAIIGRNNAIRSTEGTTVQQPEFASTSVNTTVSVPDGGTILLGGIKRLSEGRTERGVPMLSKIPYVNRLFRNVGIGRETSSLMFMVTPRIIIQEEEEFDQTQYQAP